MGGCQNYGPFLGTLNIRCRTIIRTQKVTLILTTTHIEFTGTQGMTAKTAPEASQEKLAGAWPQSQEIACSLSQEKLIGFRV